MGTPAAGGRARRGRLQNDVRSLTRTIVYPIFDQTLVKVCMAIQISVKFDNGRNPRILSR